MTKRPTAALAETPAARRHAAAAADCPNGRALAAVARYGFCQRRQPLLVAARRACARLEIFAMLIKIRRALPSSSCGANLLSMCFRTKGTSLKSRVPSRGSGTSPRRSARSCRHRARGGGGGLHRTARRSAPAPPQQLHRRPLPVDPPVSRCTGAAVGNIASTRVANTSAIRTEARHAAGLCTCEMRLSAQHVKVVDAPQVQHAGPLCWRRRHPSRSAASAQTTSAWPPRPSR